MKHYLVEFECVTTSESSEYRFKMSEVFELNSALEVNDLKQQLHFRFIQNPHLQGWYQTHEGSINADKYQKAQAEVQELRLQGKISEKEFMLYILGDCSFSHITKVTLIEDTTQ